MMYKIIIICSFLLGGLFTSANAQNMDVLELNQEETDAVFAELDQLDSQIKYAKGLNEIEIQEISPEILAQLSAPGSIPSFWWSFTLSAIGTYTIYGVVVGPISVLVVYMSTNADKIETKKALWGWVAGTAVGAGFKFISLGL